MGWTAGKNWTTGETLNVWKLQTYWTDQLLSARNLWDAACHVSMTSAPQFDISESQVFNPIPWRTIDWQIGTGTFSTREPTKFKAPIPGWYELTPTTVWTTASGGTRTQSYRLNGAAPNFDMHSVQTNNIDFRPACVGVALVQVTTADYAEVVVRQNSAQDDEIGLLGNGPEDSRCSWRLIGAAS